MSTGETVFTLTYESSQLLEEHIPLESKKKNDSYFLFVVNILLEILLITLAIS